MNCKGMPVDQESVGTKTIIVKRMKLSFNEVESRIINFTDITSYIRLKHEEEVNNLLRTLNASVHHEMVVPLRVNIEMADRLKNKLKNFPQLLNFADTIFLSSSMVLLHAYDFLDYRLIEKGVFSPCFQLCKIEDAIKETADLVKMTLQERPLKIVCISMIDRVQNTFQFDKRRFQ